MMKRRSMVPFDYSVPTEEEDDDFVDGKSNREKNNNYLNKTGKASGKASGNTKSLKVQETRKESESDRSGAEEEEEEEEKKKKKNEGSDSESIEDKPYQPRKLTSTSVSVVNKRPKKLLLTKKSRAKEENDENRPSGETVTLVRGLKDRKFVLFKSDNFNFSVNKNARSDLVHHFSQVETNGPSILPSALLVKPLLNSIRPLRVSHTLGVFDRRVTAIEWHPTFSNKVAVGSKGGEITLLDNSKPDPTEEAIFLTGVGAGGSIGAMRFCPNAPEWLLTSCLNSTVELKNIFSPSKTKILYDTGDWNKWFVSCDLNSFLYAAGQSTGIVQLFDRRSLDMVTEQKIHKGKITHVEFSKHHEYLLATASAVGHDVKIWDVRNMKNAKNQPSPLHVLPHDAGVNVASFSSFNGQRLLTSDQYGQIRVYALPGFYLERSILHPHRQFQHLTPIKAAWHPLQDLIVIGRWPDPDFVGYSANEKRTIDIFDANTGNLSLQLFDGSLKGIISLNKFSNDGQFLCSGMSRHVLFWRQPTSWNGDAMEAQMDAILCGDLIDGGGDSKSKGNKKRPPKKKETKTKDTKTATVKVKVKTTKKTAKGKKKSNHEDD